MESGVGTQIAIASGSVRRVRSVVAENLPSVTARATAAAGTSWMCERPALTRSTTAWLTSKPSTR